MTRDEVMEIGYFVRYGIHFLEGQDSAYAAGWKDARRALSLPLSPWVAIKTKDDLPPIGERVVMQDRETGERLYGYIARNGKFLTYSSSGPLHFDVKIFIAWMPIPPFEGRKEKS